MTYNSKLLIVCLSIAGLSVIGTSSSAMDQVDADNKFVTTLHSGVPGQRILSMLPSLEDIAALRGSCRDLHSDTFWDHERPIIVRASDLRDENLPLFDSLHPRNPIILDLSSSPDALNLLSRMPLELYPQLQELILRGNYLTSVPNEIGLLTQLKVLCLNGNQLPVEELAKVCKSCPQLQELGLCGNFPPSVPAEIGLLTQLKILDLRFNVNLPISEIAKVCRLCPQLQVLMLNSNWLTALPNEIGLLTQLKVLNLSDNNFSQAEKERIRQLLKQSAPQCTVSF